MFISAADECWLDKKIVANMEIIVLVLLQLLLRREEEEGGGYYINYFTLLLLLHRYIYIELYRQNNSLTKRTVGNVTFHLDLGFLFLFFFV